MKKPVIAVDIDEVLMPHFESLITWYNEQYGTSLTPLDNHPSDPGNWGTDDVEVAIRRVHKFYDTSEYMESQPFSEAKQILDKLSEKYDLVIVTARDTIIEAATRDWLEEHFEELFSQIHFTAHFSLEGKKRAKIEVLKQIGADYIIDDSLEHISVASKQGVEGILFGDYAWNQSEDLPNGVKRCKDWQEVAKYLGV